MLQVHFKLYEKEADIVLVKGQLEVLGFVVDISGILAILSLEIGHDCGCSGSGVVPADEDVAPGGGGGLPPVESVPLGLLLLQGCLPGFLRVARLVDRLASASSNFHTTCALRLDFSHENLNPDRLIGSR